MEQDSVANAHDSHQRLGESEESHESEIGRSLSPPDFSLTSSDPSDAEENVSPNPVEEHIANGLPVKVANEEHSIEYRDDGSELSIGVCSTWTDVRFIHDALRHVGLTQGVRNAYTAARNANRKTNQESRVWREKTRAYDKIKNHSLSSKYTRGDRNKDLEEPARKMRQASRNLEVAMRAEKTAVRAYILEAINVDDNIVAEILGANMPIIERQTDTAPANAGAVRYHTGAIGDPIPITWYKPDGDYNDINVDDQSTGASVTLKPKGPNPSVTGADGKTYDFGVDANAFPLTANQTWVNMPKHGKDRKVQQGLNQVLAGMNYDLSAHGEDGDHVKDLGFGGYDRIDNFWPLDSTINRYAFNGWRSTYNINFKKQKDGAGNWEIVKAPLNSGALIGKHFTIVAEEATANPAVNGTANAGSSTGWGAAENIIANDGTVIAEG